MNLDEKNTAIEEAKELIDDELYSGAIERLQSVLDDYPDDLDALYFLTHIYWDNHQDEPANEMAETFLDRFPRAMRSNLLYADFLCKIGEWKKARDYYNVARELCPQDQLNNIAEEYIERGSKQWLRGDEEGAVNHWTLATPRFNCAHPRLANCFDVLVKNESVAYGKRCLELMVDGSKFLAEWTIAAHKDPSLRDKTLGEIKDRIAEVKALNKEPH